MSMYSDYVHIWSLVIYRRSPVNALSPYIILSLSPYLLPFLGDRVCKLVDDKREELSAYSKVPTLWHYLLISSSPHLFISLSPYLLISSSPRIKVQSDPGLVSITPAFHGERLIEGQPYMEAPNPA